MKKQCVWRAGGGGEPCKSVHVNHLLKTFKSFPKVTFPQPSPLENRHFSMPKASHDLSSSSLFSLTFCCHLPQNPCHWPFMPGKLNYFTEVRPTFCFCLFVILFYPLCLIPPPVIHMLNSHLVSTVQLHGLSYYKPFFTFLNRVIIHLLFSLLNLKKKKKYSFGTCLAVQWLGLGAFTALGPGSIPGWRTKILQAV